MICSLIGVLSSPSARWRPGSLSVAGLALIRLPPPSTTKTRADTIKTNPKPGDQIFFKNSQRICHTGIVVKVANARIYTIEGNTSGASGVIANGGGVCQKEYPVNAAGIDGYGRPDWKLVEMPEHEPGWHRDSNGWWFADTKSTYYKSCW